MLPLPSLTSLPQDLVDQQHAEAAARLQEAFPDLDLKRGVFHDTVLYFHSQLAAAQQLNLSQYLAGRSLSAIEANPDLADPATVDEVLSCWGVTRSLGSVASGLITITLGRAVNVTIEAGAVFEADGLQFQTTEVHAAKTSEALVTSSSDRLIIPTADGYYSFTLPISALAVGSQYNLAKGTTVTPLSPPTSFLAAVATADFLGGSDEETNQDILTRQQVGISAKGFASVPTNLQALLTEETTFGSRAVSSVVGMGNPEMLRDQHSLIPISYGGRLDWYIRTQPRLMHGLFTKTATLIEKQVDGTGIWQFSLSKDAFPGFYEIYSIKLTTNTDAAGSFEVTEDIRGLDLTGSTILPDIQTVAEGAYTAYQTATIRFHDTTTNVTALALGDTQSYDVDVLGMPWIGTAQELCTSEEFRCRTADTLVKAPVPCFVSVSLVIHKRDTDPDPDTASIAAAIVKLINGIGFTGRLFASQIHDVMHGYLSGAASVGAADMLGRIRRPDGTILRLISTEVLTIPDEPENMVTPRTVQFYAEETDIAIDVVTDIPVPI